MNEKTYRYFLEHEDHAAYISTVLGKSPDKYEYALNRKGNRNIIQMVYTLSKEEFDIARKAMDEREYCLKNNEVLLLDIIKYSQHAREIGIAQKQKYRELKAKGLM